MTIAHWSRYLMERFALPVFLPSAFLHVAFLLQYTAPSRLWTDWRLIIVGTLTYIGIFLILRLSDELKDKSHDDQFYPDRPVQRGLLSLTQIRRGLVLVIVGIIVINLFVFSVKTFLILLLVGGYMTLMRYEFFIPHILRPRILLYLVTHQLFVPLFFCYYFALVGRWPTSNHDGVFLLINLLMLMSIEVARKIRPRVLENASRDTYSAALGRGRASLFLFGLLIVSQGLLVRLGLVHTMTWFLVVLPMLAILLYYVSDSRLAAKAVMGSTTIIIATWMLLAL